MSLLSLIESLENLLGESLVSEAIDRNKTIDVKSLKDQGSSSAELVRMLNRELNGLLGKGEIRGGKKNRIMYRFMSRRGEGRLTIAISDPSNSVIVRVIYPDESFITTTSRYDRKDLTPMGLMDNIKKIVKGEPLLTRKNNSLR